MREICTASRASSQRSLRFCFGFDCRGTATIRCFSCRNLLRSFASSSHAASIVARAGFIRFVGRNRIVELQNVARRNRAGAHVLSQPDHFLNDQRAARQNAPGLRLAALDAARDADFAFAVEKRHRTHLAQIEPHRIVGLVEALDFDEFVGFFEARRSSALSSTRSERRVERSPSTSGGISSMTSSNSTKPCSLLTQRKWIDGLELVFRHWNHSPIRRRIDSLYLNIRAGILLTR